MSQTLFFLGDLQISISMQAVILLRKKPDFLLACVRQAASIVGFEWGKGFFTIMNRFALSLSIRPPLHGHPMDSLFLSLLL